MKIMWTNRFSLQEGFVRDVETDHFINTFDKAEGKNFKTRREAQKAIEHLYDCGEGLNNEFTIVTNK
jgi:hypothetical protein